VSSLSVAAERTMAKIIARLFALRFPHLSAVVVSFVVPSTEVTAVFLKIAKSRKKAFYI